MNTKHKRIALIRFVLILYSIFLNGIVFAQSGVLAAGQSTKNSFGSFSYSVGLTAFAQSDGELIVTQGIQQPYEFVVINAIENNEIAVDIFPNPVNEQIIVSVTNVYDNMVFDLLDGNGKSIGQGAITKDRTLIDIGTRSHGIYFLKIKSQNNYSVHKIIKN